MSDPSPLSRRAVLAAGACLLCSCASNPAATRTAKPADPVDAGPLDHFAREGIYDDWADSHGFFLVRQANRLYALSSSCTHRHYDLESKGDQIVCPKHGSRFTPAGQVIKGPAASPLPRFAIHLTAARTVVIDPSKIDPNASIPLA
jgi:cytochrome b6-f complex iron-sulfur subunit